MKAKSDSLRATKPKRTTPRRHLRYDDRRAQILEKAILFFSEYGLTGQTRRLAVACGVSQRLLYRYFPNKAALLDEVYREAIAKPFDETWLADLDDAAVPLRDRLRQFYARYTEVLLQRRWLRLFLYSALAENPMPAAYADSIVSRILDVLVRVAARDLGVQLPADRDSIRRLGWTLHGAIVLGGIRRHIYRLIDDAGWQGECDCAIDIFIAALPEVCRRAPTARRTAGKPRLAGAVD
ncbi:MAG: TetR/AcrR family transcriptional regulator [Alphaproteobacteria bacterium]|nr:TetR/AcrR family transcriptional regulator [Alphaproteobacteria bacterium]